MGSLEWSSVMNIWIKWHSESYIKYKSIKIERETNKNGMYRL